MTTALRTLGWLPPNGSLHGARLDSLLAWNLAVLTAVLLLAHLLLLWSLVRRRPSTAIPSAASSALPRPWLAEWLPTLGCAALFAGMAISSERLWAALRYEGPVPGAMQVEVVGVQFQWYFRYPGDDAHFGGIRPALVNAAAGNPLGLDPADSHGADDIVASVLVLPAGREVDLRLRAHDVIHGFFIPGMRLMLHVHFTPTAPGTYPILCTQVCGSGHARMQAALRVVSAPEYAAWIAARERARPVQALQNTRAPQTAAGPRLEPKQGGH